MGKDFKVEPMQAHTLSWWRNRKEQIDMDPPYQRRGRLWSDADKAYLIDSIINGFDVPKIYMADFTWGTSSLNKRKLPYAIIDGKQRFEAIFDFFDGTIVLNSDFQYIQDPTLKLGGLGYKDLVKTYPQVRELFDEYNLYVMAVMAHSKEKINDLFVRLNRSKPLSGAEIRNAMTGPVPELFRQIAKHDLFQDNVAFAVKRGQDLNAAAKILYFEYEEKPVETKKKVLDQLVTMGKSPKNKKTMQLAARKVLDGLDAMSEIFLPSDLSETAPDEKSQPVFFSKREDLFTDLLYEMGTALGYEFDKTEISREAYSTVFHGKVEADLNLIRERLVAILTGDASLPMEIVKIPSDPALIAKQAEYLKVMIEYLRDGKGLPITIVGGDANKVASMPTPSDSKAS